MTDSIEYRPRAQKDIKNLPINIQKAILSTVELLSETPRPPKCKKLRGGNNLYRVKIRKTYRIIYQIQDNKLVILVVKVGHRKNIYTTLE